MQDYLSAQVPKKLRIQASVQMQSLRLPLKAFLYCAGVIVVAGLLILVTGNLIGVAKVCVPALLIGLVILEGKWWGGRKSWACVQIIVRHFQRQKMLRSEPVFVTSISDGETLAAIRKPRWQAEEEDMPTAIEASV